MKNTKFIICLISLLVLSTSISNVKAQNKTITQNFLMNKKWEMSGLTDKTVKEEYNKTVVKYYFNGKPIGESFYYLSNEVDSIFNESKVGKISSGKYIISRVKHAKNDNFSVFEIISTGQKALILRNIKHTHHLKYIFN